VRDIISATKSMNIKGNSEGLLSDPRIHYLDNIRSIIIVFVVIFHAILPYVQACPWWYVHDPPPIPYSFIFTVLLEPILMPILFLFAGMLTWPSYERKGARFFMKGKVKRLLFPFLLCTLFFSPILPFIRHNLRAAKSGTDPLGFKSFWLNFLKSGTKIQSGSASTSPDIVVNQYWFLMLLFIFFAGFCLFVLKHRKTSSTLAGRMAKEQSSRLSLVGSIMLFCLVLGAIYALICLVFDGNVWVTLGSLWQIQPAKIHIYLGFFLAGIYIERRNLLSGLLHIVSPTVWFTTAALLTAGYLTTVIKTAGLPDASMTLVIASRFLRIFFVVSVSLWLLTFFHRRINKSTLFWRELSGNSYNIYLIHMVPQVVIQLILLSCPTVPLFKFAAVSLLTLVVSYLFSRFLVNRSSAATIIVLVLIISFMTLVFR
jgi:surface polysaccharide O-acyltransferase-like enzyme